MLSNNNVLPANTAPTVVELSRKDIIWKSIDVFHYVRCHAYIYHNNHWLQCIPKRTKKIALHVLTANSGLGRTWKATLVSKTTLTHPNSKNKRDRKTNVATANKNSDYICIKGKYSEKNNIDS